MNIEGQNKLVYPDLFLALPLSNPVNVTSSGAAWKRYTHVMFFPEGCLETGENIRDKRMRWLWDVGG